MVGIEDVDHGAYPIEQKEVFGRLNLINGLTASQGQVETDVGIAGLTIGSLLVIEDGMTDIMKAVIGISQIVIQLGIVGFLQQLFKVDAADYLLKPFGMDEFRRAALRVKQRYEMAVIPKAKITDEDDTVFIKTDKKIMKIAFVHDENRPYASRFVAKLKIGPMTKLKVLKPIMIKNGIFEV